MSLVPQQAAFLRDVAKLIDFASARGFTVTGGELERKKEMQQIYVQTGRSKTMDSMHLRRCAVDLNFFREEGGEFKLTYDVDALREVGKFWEGLDSRNRWGGNWNSFKDIPHFERNLNATPYARVASAPAQAAPKAVDAVLMPASTSVPADGTTVAVAVALPSEDATVAVAVSVPAGAASEGVDAAVVVVPAADADAGGALMRTVQKGSGDLRAVSLLQTLLHEAGVLPSVDGSFGPGTERAVRQFQTDKGLKVDGVVSEKTWTALIAAAPAVFQTMSSRWIGEADFDAAAERLQCDGACVRAVYEVESGGSGFLGLKPRILFEGHVFWQRLIAAGLDPRTLSAGHEDILFEHWDRRFYKGGLAEYERLERAMALHKGAALESASWGLFQVLGLHWKPMHYPGIDDFVDKMNLHEREHLMAFCAFVETKSVHGKPLTRVLRERDWPTFALGYNGPAYRENRYDDRLAAAYAKHAG